MPRKADWTATKISGLYRYNRSGRYHVRATKQGREIWKALGTSSYEIAKVRARELLSEIHRSRDLTASLAGGKPTFGAVAELYRERVRTSTKTKQSTKDYWAQTIDSLLRSWPALAETRISAITEEDCRQWSSRYLNSSRAAGHNWKTEPGKTISASRFNNTLSSLRSVLAIGIERGLILRNPASSVERVTPKRKPMRIPSRGLSPYRCGNSNGSRSDESSLRRSGRISVVQRMSNRRVEVDPMVGRRPGAETDLDRWTRGHRNEERTRSIRADHSADGAVVE